MTQFLSALRLIRSHGGDRVDCPDESSGVSSLSRICAGGNSLVLFMLYPGRFDDELAAIGYMQAQSLIFFFELSAN